jgi:TorA maturation chaperone TorD
MGGISTNLLQRQDLVKVSPAKHDCHRTNPVTNDFTAAGVLVPAVTLTTSPSPLPSALFLSALADDAESLAALHDRELTPELLQALKQSGFPESLGLLPTTDSARAAWRAMADALADLPESPTPQDMDELASEYAAIYLTGAYGASPCESAWTDDEHLNCQAAMFEWRELHAAAGLVATDWRQRPDDHLVLQLLYAAHAARQVRTNHDWLSLAHVFDRHILRWLPAFAARVTARSLVPFYAGLALLTSNWAATARNLLHTKPNKAEPATHKAHDWRHNKVR